ncbi:MAG: HAD family hydrolase, partial [Lachnospiraceae bacterium]|nr:HAD family hydrolase [Lachnospiraceae bacterium]
MNTVLFDLDGTLLPMDMTEFTEGYFKYLVKMLAPHGYDPKELIKNVWGGTAAMVKNDGSCMNEAAFWNYFTG